MSQLAEDLALQLEESEKWKKQNGAALGQSLDNGNSIRKGRSNKVLDP